MTSSSSVLKRSTSCSDMTARALAINPTPLNIKKGSDAQSHFSLHFKRKIELQNVNHLDRVLSLTQSSRMKHEDVSKNNKSNQNNH